MAKLKWTRERVCTKVSLIDTFLLYLVLRLNKGLRIEWCKSKCRADRWREEVELLQEERKHILLFFEYQASEWQKRSQRDEEVWMLPGVRYDPVAVDGREAYARHQAHQFREMVSHFRAVWRNIDAYISSNGQEDNVSIYPPEVELDTIENDADVPLPTDIIY